MCGKVHRGAAHHPNRTHERYKAGSKRKHKDKKATQNDDLKEVIGKLKQMGMERKEIDQIKKAAASMQKKGWRPDQIAEQIKQILDQGKTRALAEIKPQIQHLLQTMMGRDDGADSGATGKSTPAGGTSPQGAATPGGNPPQSAATPEGTPPQAINSPAGMGDQSLVSPEQASLQGDNQSASRTVAALGQRDLAALAGAGPNGIEFKGLTLTADAGGRLSAESMAKVNALISKLSMSLKGKEVHANVYKAGDGQLHLQLTVGEPNKVRFAIQPNTIYGVHTHPAGSMAVPSGTDVANQIPGAVDAVVRGDGSGRDARIYDTK